MEFAVGLGILLFVIWILFIRGFLWRLIIGVVAFLAMHEWFSNHVVSTNATFMTILGTNITWATIIPAVIILLAMMTTNKN